MMIPSGRKKILKEFLADPFKEIHLRAIARLAKSSLTNVDNSMRLFVKNGMFIREEHSNSSFFRPNLENDETLKLFELFEVERRQAFYSKNKSIARLIKKYSESIIELSAKRIQLVILFGSVARGEWTKNSDIDILAVIPGKENGISDIMNKSKVNVGPSLTIAPITTTIDKFKEGFKAKSEFHENLWKDRIVLYNEFLFWQLIKEGGK